MKNLLHILKIVVIILCLFCLGNAKANNLSISNAQLTGQNTSGGSGSTGNYIMVQFDISWENSFRDAINWDAAWVFIKFKTSGGTTWKHATLTNTGNTAPTGSTISVTSDGKGAFIYRTDTGSGTLSLTSVKLKWYYVIDSIGDNEAYNIKVMGCEMVYVPAASFYAGSGGSGTSEFTKTYINTANATTAPSGSASPKSGGYPTSQTAPSNSSWPNGYNAFYCMKYEISQGQYTDFLNCLARTQQNHMVNSTVSSSSVSGGKNYVMCLQNWALNRNYIMCPASGNGTSDAITFSCAGANIACNYMTYGQVASYLDWSGLRPMTELEFEKACRGDQTPVSNEYAWGTTCIYSSSYSLSHSADTNEVASSTSTTTGNAVYFATGASYIDGVVRTGMFATSSTSRVTAGASYYGIMELSGNNWERAVSIANSTGRGYKGSHGDGNLTSGGYATNTDWPGYSSGSGFVSNGTGCGYRGGSIAYGSTKLRVSDREWIGYTDYSYHWGRSGRGVRTAP